MSTLESRLKEVTQDLQRGWKAQLARELKINQSSISEWLSGDTKSINSIYLHKTAAFLRVNPEWLASGEGPKEAPIEGVPPAPLPPKVNVATPPTIAQAVQTLALVLENADASDKPTVIHLLTGLVDRPETAPSVARALEGLLHRQHA